MTKNKTLVNFGAGPAALPQEVLTAAATAVINYNNTGLSILEIPHRGKLFDAILEESNALVKELTGLGDDYEVIWLPGGGRLQFAMIPMNFLGQGATAGYIDSGHWSNDAMRNGSYYGNAITLSSTRDSNYTSLPPWPQNITDDLSYLHFTTNNTIYGTQWSSIPVANVPLVADMSSDIFSSRRDYQNCALFYAVAQKNMGAAGVTLVVLRKEMLQQMQRKLPPMLDYAQHVLHKSVLNTPPVFAIYVSLLMLRWTKAKGIAQIEKDNNEKSAMLYAEIDRNPMFYGIVVNKDHRSKMNVVFRCYEASKEQTFLNLCEANNIKGIAGHRSVGGFRASLYNTISIADVKTLVLLMQDFEQNNK